MNNSSNIFSNIYRTDNLPPRTVSKNQKESDKWKKAMLDAFEHEAITQFNDNLEFTDLYRMVEGKITYQELSEVAPHMKDIQALLDGVGVPSFLRHYDIIGIVVNAIVGYYNSMQPKFHVTDTGEVAQNEFQRFKTEEFQKTVLGIIEKTIQLHLAQNGLDPESNQEFASQEEQQAYVQKLQSAIQEFTPKDTERDSKQTFKTAGVKWGEATIEKDREMFDFLRMERKELKDQLVSGRCFRHYRIGFDEYEPETWSPKQVFFSREIGIDLAHKGEYIGRLNYITPAEAIRRYGHEITTRDQEKLLGGNKDWKHFVGDGAYNSGITSALRNNAGKPMWTPFQNFEDYNFMLGLQDELGSPMGTQTYFNKDGTQTVSDRFLPRMMGSSFGRYTDYARLLRDDYRHRNDLCQETQVYFRAYDKWGYLTYEDEDGVYQTEEVTEDILEDFLKEKGIKKTFDVKLVDVVKEFKPNTLQWTNRPVVYEGVKLQAPYLSEPLYVYCRPCEHQIKGSSQFDVWLPVAGYIGKSTARKIEPYQAKYNLCMNQIYSLLEKEVGVFFLLDTTMIPSEYEEWGNAADALTAMRSVAKEIGILPIATSGDANKNLNNFNQFSTYNLSYTGQLADRIKIAEFNQRKAYEVVGINPTILQSPTKYETAEGVKTNQEATFAQISEIYEDFEYYVKACYELHLSVAQYCQANKKDISLYYTKSDSSIVHLKLSDPEFPLRNIGVIASADSKRRKELETLKTYLLNNNTLGSDTLEIAKLVSSDGMSEAIEIANEALSRRAKQEQDNHARQMEAIQSKAEFDKQQSEANWEREEESKQRDRQAKIYIEQISALGRASDKQSDTDGFNQINKNTELALKATDLDFKQEQSSKEFARKEKQDEDMKQIRMEELKLKAQTLQERMLKRKSDEHIAAINKN